jgi:predicted PurR-regulated permease PerM
MEISGKTAKTITKIIVIAVLLCFALEHIAEIFTIVATVLGVLSPLLIGFCLAFVLNVPMDVWEKKVFKKAKLSQSKKRVFSILLTFISVILVLVLVVWLIVPQIVNAGESMAQNFPAAAEKFEKFMEQNLSGNHQIESGIAQLGIDTSQYIQDFTNYLKNSSSDIMSKMMQVVSGTFSAIMNVFIGLIFAIYILAQKEMLGRQARKITMAFLPEKAANRIFEICSLTANTFRKFITGQCLEAVILSSIFAVVLSIFHIPYAIPISVLIMVTALIPVLGSFIGCFTGIILILVVNPMQALLFLVLFLVIQQIEGNLIYPHVVGGSVGLPSIWVFAAVIIGGNLFGIVGMLVFIPLCSVVYALLKQSVNHRLSLKKSKKLEKAKTL